MTDNDKAALGFFVGCVTTAIYSRYQCRRYAQKLFEDQMERAMARLEGKASYELEPPPPRRRQH